jgi:adenylate cyclase
LLENGTPVALGGRAFDLLVALVEGRGGIMTKEALMRRVWPDSAVEENNLTVTISALRKALREQPHDQKYIRTISGRGYRFIAPLHDALAPASGAAPSAVVAVQEKPGIVVLPFVDLADAPVDAHFGRGIAEEIILALSRNRWLTVIASASAFSARQHSTTAEFSGQMGVRYGLEGTIRRSSTHIRVSARLVDASTGAQLLAERYDREMADIFAVQDDISARIVAAVRPAVYDAEQARSIRKHPESIDAWAAYQRGMWHFSRTENPESAEAQAWFERAIALDERFAPGFYGLANVFVHDGSSHLPQAPADWQQRAEMLALHAVALDLSDSGAHSILGVARMVRGDHQGALDATEAALSLNPNDATAYGTRGATLVFLGRVDEGLGDLDASLRLSPRDPRLHVRQAHIGLGLYFARRYDEAEAKAQQIMERWPTNSFAPRLLAMVLAETGRLEEARAALDAAIALGPSRFSDYSHARMPWYRPCDHARALAALRLAGWDGYAA